MERFPQWVRTPDDFYELDLDTQSLLMTYEAIRESEEVLLRR